MQNAPGNLMNLVAFPSERGDGVLERLNRGELQPSKVSAHLTDTAFTELVEQHSRLLYKIAMTVTRHPQDAEDTVQETFLELYRGRRWDQIDDARAYLARMAWRIAVRRHKGRSIDREEEFSRAFPSSDLSPEDKAIDWQLESKLHALIDQLPEKLRQPLALSGLGELSQVEIAKILGLPEGTVRRRIHTARQKLRAQWQRSAQATGGNV